MELESIEAGREVLVNGTGKGAELCSGHEATAVGAFSASLAPPLSPSTPNDRVHIVLLPSASLVLVPEVDPFLARIGREVGEKVCQVTVESSTNPLRGRTRKFSRACLGNFRLRSSGVCIRS